MCFQELENLREEYLIKSRNYAALEKITCQKLESAIQLLGINFKIESRVKTVDSFIKKQIKNNYSNPLVEIKDQLGIRIITTYPDEIEKIDQVIQKEFSVSLREDKLDSLEYNQLGYLGIHFEVVLPNIEEQCATSCNEHSTGEIQLRTKAQDLWANVSHQLSYKPTSSISTNLTGVQRSIYRLIALIELFDKEVSDAQDIILSQPNFPEAKLLKHLEAQFYLFTVRDFDREFSIQNITHLKKLLSEEESNNFENLIKIFVENNKVKLSGIFEVYLNDKRESYKVFMLFQPEVLLVFERLEKDRFKLMEIWREFLPFELLKYLAEDVWSVGLPSV